MAVSIEELRIGPSRAMVFDQGTAEWAIVLPGAGYTAQAPLLWYARVTAIQSHRNVLVITDVFDHTKDEPVTWVGERGRAALDRVRSHDPHPLLIAKSLTSLAATLAAQENLPAVWLTPLLADDGTDVTRVVRDALHKGDAPRLLVGGAIDPAWDGSFAASLPAAEILELPDSDHSLEVPGDLTRSLANLSQVSEAMGRFLERIRGIRP